MCGWPRVIRTQGSLLGDEYAMIGAKVAGRIQHVGVDLGSRVSLGDELVSLELQGFELLVQQAEAQLRKPEPLWVSSPMTPPIPLTRRRRQLCW